MEVARVMLSLAGHFPSDGYKDQRWVKGGGGSMVPADDPSSSSSSSSSSSFEEGVRLEANVGRMPILHVVGGGDGDESVVVESVGQSSAIWLYVAKRFGFMGSSLVHEAHVIGILETLQEVKTAYRSLCPYGQEPTEENLDLWFDGGATDFEGVADITKRSQRFLTWWMGRLERQLPSSSSPSYAVGSSTTLADVAIHDLFLNYLEKDDASDSVQKWVREPFGDKARTDALLAKHPKLKAICEQVAQNPNYKKWLSIRGKQDF